MWFRIGNKWLRRTFWWVMRPFLVLVVALIALQIFGKMIAEKLLADIFRVPVKTASVSFDHRAAFPETQVLVKGLQIQSSDSSIKKDIFQIQRASVQLNVWKTLYRRFLQKNSRLQITSIQADCVKVFFAENFNGKRNFDGLFKGKPGGPKRPPPALIELQNITLSRTVFRFFSEKKFKDYLIGLDTTKVNIQVKPHQIEIKGDLAGKTQYIQIQKLRILDDFPLTGHLAINYMKDAKKVYFLPATTVGVGNTTLELKGSMGVGKEQTFDLKFNTRKGSVQTLLGLLPARTRHQLAQYDAQGDLELLGSMRGTQSETTDPHFEIKFYCQDASFKNLKTKAQVSQTHFHGVYSNGERNSVATTLFSLDTVEGYLGKRPFYSSFRLKDFHNPLIDLELKSTFIFSDMMNLVGLAVNDSAKGEADVNISAHGPLYYLTSENKNDSLRFKGSIELLDVSMATDSFPVEVQNVNGKILLKDSDLWVENMHGVFNGDPLQCALSVKNIVPFLLSKKQTKERLDVEAELALGSFDADKFMETWKHFKPVANTPKQVQRQQKRQIKKEKNIQERELHGFLPQLPVWLNGKINVIVHHLNYNNLNFDLLKTTIILEDRSVNVQDFILQDPKHKVEFTGQWDSGQDHHHLFKNGRLQFHSDDLFGLINDAGFIKNQAEHKAADVKKHQIHFITTLNGSWEKESSNGAHPRLTGAIKLYNGHYQQVGGKIGVRELEVKIPLHEGFFYDFNHTPIIIDSIFGVIEPRYRFKGKVMLESLASQNVKAEISSSLAMSTLLSIFSIPTIQNPTGTIDLEAKVAGKLFHITSPDSFSKVQTEGVVQLRKVGFDFSQTRLPVRDFSVDFVFTPDQLITVKDLKGSVGHTHLTGLGYVENMIGYIYGKTSELKGNLSLNADTLDIESFLSRNGGKKGGEIHLDLPRAMHLMTHVEVGHVYFDKLNLDHVNMDAHLVDQKVMLDRLYLETCSGKVTANGLIDAEHQDSLGIFLNLFIQGVDMGQVLRSLNNFNQTFITDEKIQGKLNAQVIIADVLPKHLLNNYDNLEVAINFSITDGNLAGMDFLTKKLNFIFRQKYLKNIPYVMKGKNWRFMNRKLVINELELKSSLFDILMKGSQEDKKNFFYKLKVIRVGRKEREILPTLFVEHKNKYDESIWVFDIQATGKKPKLRWDWITARQNFWRKMTRSLVEGHH